jgi:hypothetical protein
MTPVQEALDILLKEIKVIEKQVREDPKDASYDEGFVDGLMWAVDLVETVIEKQSI